MTNNPENIMEKCSQFLKKGEIKRRIIQGDQELAYDAERLYKLCEWQQKRIQQLEEVLRSTHHQEECKIPAGHSEWVCSDSCNVSDVRKALIPPPFPLSE